MALLHCCICHLLTVHWHEAPKDAWLGHIAGDVVHVAQYCSAAQTLIDAGSPMDFLIEATRDDPSWWVRQVKKACSEVQKDFEQWRKHGARPEAGGDASLPGVTEPAARDFPCAWCGARLSGSCPDCFFRTPPSCRGLKPLSLPGPQRVPERVQQPFGTKGPLTLSLTLARIRKHETRRWTALKSAEEEKDPKHDKASDTVDPPKTRQLDSQTLTVGLRV